MLSFKTFLKQLTIIAVLLLIISYILDKYAIKINLTAAYPLILGFLYLVTIGVYRLLSLSMEKRLSKFANVYMLVNFAKLIFFTIIIVLYAVMVPEEAVSFMLCFFSYYFIFTGFEIVSLLKNK